MAMVTWDDGGGVGLDPPPGDVESLLAAQLGLLQQQLSVQNAQIELLLHNTTPQAAMEAATTLPLSIVPLMEAQDVDSAQIKLTMVPPRFGLPTTMHKVDMQDIEPAQSGLVAVLETESDRNQLTTPPMS